MAKNAKLYHFKIWDPSGKLVVDKEKEVGPMPSGFWAMFHKKLTERGYRYLVQTVRKRKVK